LPSLIANLVEAFQFNRVDSIRLDQLAAWRLEGEWKPSVLAELAPDQKEQIGSGGVNWKKVAPQVPRRVVLILGQDDLLPYRIEYLREPTDKVGKLQPGPLGPIVTIDLLKVQCRVAIAPQKFTYSPGDRRYNDQTEAYLKKLGIDSEPTQDALRQRPPTGIQR
jgi:hypothetical protein